VKLLVKKDAKWKFFKILEMVDSHIGTSELHIEICSSNLPKLWCVEDMCGVMLLQKE